MMWIARVIVMGACSRASRPECRRTGQARGHHGDPP